LESSTTVYGVIVTVNGTSNQVLVTGTSAQIYSNLIVAINADLTGASCALFGGNLKFFSSTYGTASTISIRNVAGTGSVALLTTLTDFVGLATAVAGTNAVIELPNQPGGGADFTRYAESDFDPPIRFQTGLSTEFVIGDGGEFRLYYSR
jgi:hypothetical protein